MSDNIFDRMAAGADVHMHAAESSDAAVAADRGDNAETESATDLTAIDVKRVLQELLRHGYLEESKKRDLYRLANIHDRAMLVALEPLDLALRIDAHRGIAFLFVAQSAYEQQDNEALWTHPLVRRQRLTLEQSLLVAILRQAFVIHEQESGIGECDAKIAVDDLLPQFAAYFGDTGSDARNESRLLSLLDQLKTYGIVSEVDRNQEVVIRPLIAYLANPDSLAALLLAFTEKSLHAEPAEDDN